jgi:hypothetical protein
MAGYGHLGMFVAEYPPIGDSASEIFGTKISWSPDNSDLRFCLVCRSQFFFVTESTKIRVRNCLFINAQRPNFFRQPGPWSRLAQIYFVIFLTFAFLVVAADL